MKHYLTMFIWIPGLFSCLIVGAWASEIKPDEKVVLYPAVAHLNDNNEWEAVMTAWVYEEEVRPGAKNTFARWLRIKIDELNEQEANHYEVRTQLFRFDSERNKKIAVQIAEKEIIKFPLTNAQGVSQKKLIYKPIEDAQLPVVIERLALKVILPLEDERNFFGQLILVPREGLSVVSDVDDTIKVSNVLNKKELLLNTFVRPFVAAEGMAAFYQELEAQNPGVSFHYVSASPHQLYPVVNGFIQENKFPAGSLHLRHIKITEEVLRKGSSSARHKHKVIRDLLERFPARKFVLIGDSGEADPEIYGAIAKDYPLQVVAIFIRNVTGEEINAPRYQKMIQRLKSIPWYVFTDPGILPIKQ